MNRHNPALPWINFTGPNFYTPPPTLEIEEGGRVKLLPRGGFKIRNALKHEPYIPLPSFQNAFWPKWGKGGGMGVIIFPWSFEQIELSGSPCPKHLLSLLSARKAILTF